MVLIRRSGVLGVLGVLLLGSCSRSLFETRDVEIDDATCGAMCVADAAADFDGTPGGANQNSWRWRYLDDHRDRSWTAMTASGNLEVTSAETGNRITTCAAHPDEPACEALPHALLVSAGTDSQADPAIELAAPAKAVIQLSVHAFVPSGEAQTIRLYRNSREDVLFTGTATAGVGFQHTITLDALEGDRFLVAVEPTGKAATGVGLHLFASAVGTTPSSCQLALPFSSAFASDTGSQCGDATFSYYVYPTDPAGPAPGLLQLDDGPFPELGRAAIVPQDSFLQGDHLLDWSHDVTVQLWVKLDTAPVTDTAWLFSDLDDTYGGGVGISLAPAGGEAINLDVSASTDPTPDNVKFGVASTTYPTDGTWNFIRVVRTDGSVSVCKNGEPLTSLPVRAHRPPGFMTTNLPYLGRDHMMMFSGAFFGGLLDDVRVITGALPCEVLP